MPREAPIGPQTLTVDWGPEEQRTASFTVLSASLTLTPGTAVANQTVIIRGSGLTPSSVPGGKGPMEVHQIAGDEQSFVALDGTRLGPTYVPYPIALDSDGTLYTTMILPLVRTTMATGELDITVTDTSGRIGTVQLDIQGRSLTISPLLSPPGSTVTLAGRGFIASNDVPTGNFSVDISYDGALQSTVVPDGFGNFVTQMTIPIKISSGFPKTITASISGNLGSATASHDVPARRLHLDPSAGPPGTILTITGLSLPGFARLSSLTLDKRPMLPAPVPATDGGGGFTASIIVPELNIGYYIVGVVIRGIQQFTNFQLTEVVVKNPLPTPEAAPVGLAASPASQAGTPAASAMGPLEGNLVDVWFLEPATGRWKYYDPSGYFGQNFNLTELIPGQLYLICS